MPRLPPPVWGELRYDGAWNDVTEDMRVTTSPVTVTRGLSSESSTDADPTSCMCDLDSRDDRYAPRNPMSPLYGKIGRNTPFRWGYTVGSPWVEMGTAENALTTPGTGLAVGDLDLRVEAALDVWAGRDLAGRYLATGENRAWALTVDATGQLVFYWSPDGTLAGRIAVFSTVAVGAHNGQRIAVRVTLDVNNGKGGYELRFYTGRTVNDTEWELLGDPIIGATTTTLINGTAELELGRVLGLNGAAAAGRLHAFRLLDGIDGRVVASMDASDATPGAVSFTSGGRVWTAVNGATLTNRHVRMAGEVPSWPPTRDLSGNDNIVSIAPAGITRRMDAGNKPQDSALRRFIKARGPLECWPLTDGVDARTAKSLVGGRDMVQSTGPLDVAPSWTNGTLTDWTEPVVAIRAGMVGGLLGYTPRRAYAGVRWSVDLFLTGGASSAIWNLILSDIGAGTNADNQVSIIMNIGGDPAPGQVSAIRNSEGSDSNSQSFLGNYTDIRIFDDQPHHIRVTVDVGPFPGWHFFVDGQEVAYHSLDVDMRPLSLIQLGWGSFGAPDLTDRAAGYLTYWDSTGPSAAEMWNAFMGFQGEGAGTRIKRLASEAGYTASTSGQPTLQQQAGIQDQAKLLALLNDANRTDFGYLLDARDRAEVIQRGGSTLWNQPPALVLDYSAGVIGAPFKPVDDDKLTENDVSVKRQYGSITAQHVLEEGELSVQDPPNGVGRYDNAYTYSLATDPQADHVASMRLHLGTYNGVRYTRLTLNLANERVFAMIDDILRIDVGDKIRLTNLPADHGPDAVDVLVHGYEESAGPDAWTITFNCRPGEPWTTGVADGADSHVDTDGSQLAAAVTATSTTVSLAVTGERLWTSDPFDMPFDLRVGGEVMTVTSPGVLVNAGQNPFFDTDTAGWSSESATLSWSGTVVHPDPHARGSLLITPSGGADFAGAIGALSSAGSVTPGTAYVMSAWVYSPRGWSDVRPSVYWYSSTGGFLSTSAGTAQAVPAGQWTFVTATFTAPASASQGRARIRHGATPTAADVLYLWAARITPTTAGASSPQTFTVIRSVNGVSKGHAAGADVRLATPTYAAL
ncbi:carbohydrate binding domain-containing protein [Streptomyces ardesiacus]|uniref:carbohydrate binding domain-containing protein n=1 Tax=Streptomyces ardesiacus TaxID=285564 RepID=UPI00382BF90D